MKIFVLALASLLANEVSGQMKKVDLPFRNLAFPIDSVVECETYSQRMEKLSHPMSSACFPITDIVFYTNQQRFVRSVISGEVVSVSAIGGFYLIIIRSNNFYFTYSAIDKTCVEAHDSVTENTVIGTTGFNTDLGKYQVSLSLDNKNGELNPDSIFKY